jgi:hypothetical protein
MSPDVYAVTLEPEQVTVAEQLIFAEECSKEVVADERALMMTAQEAIKQKSKPLPQQIAEGRRKC